MKLEFQISHSLCSASQLRINDKDAYLDDFGDFQDEGDADDGDDEDYRGCYDMHFNPKDPSPEILAKYGIDKAEYTFIANILSDGLSFGSCDMCN